MHVIYDLMTLNAIPTLNSAHTVLHIKQKQKTKDQNLSQKKKTLRNNQIESENERNNNKEKG